MPLVFVGPGFAEPGGEGRRLTGSIEMGDIAEGEHAEVGDAGTTFLCDDCGDGGWCGTGAVPQKHRGDVQQVAQKHTLQPEVAE